MFRDNLPRNIEHVGRIHQNAVLFHGTLTMLEEQEVEGFSQRALTSWAEQISFDPVEVSVSTPDYAERFKQITVNMRRRRKRLSQLVNRRRRNIDDARRRSFKPGMREYFCHLKTSQRQQGSEKINISQKYAC